MCDTLSQPKTKPFRLTTETIPNLELLGTLTHRTAAEVVDWLVHAELERRGLLQSTPSSRTGNGEKVTEDNHADADSGR